MNTSTSPGKWADMIRQQLFLLSSYDELDERRLAISINETVMDAP
jgi:hypothetical protein